jgi:NAD(P)-dependent dehydrogenase (short-subunit alcohol dehydrogenase family)
MSDNIESKVVVITGASSGNGEATARQLARHGTKLIVGARRLDRPCGYYERELLQDKSPRVSHDDSAPNAPHHRLPPFFIALVTARRCSR